LCQPPPTLLAHPDTVFQAPPLMHWCHAPDARLQLPPRMAAPAPAELTDPPSTLADGPVSLLS